VRMGKFSGENTIGGGGRGAFQFMQLLCHSGDGVPCQHMVAVSKSGVIEGFDKNNIMPVWWIMTTPKHQFPLDVTVGENMDIDWLKTRGEPDSNLRHSPAMAAPNKSGCPKKGDQIKGPLEGGRKRKRA
jgi:hypothetical protein